MKQIIKVFEYDKFYPEEHGLDKTFNKALTDFRSGKEIFPYYELIRDGVKFCNYVGVLQIDGVTIEVLPKIDRETSDKTTWQGVLIDMLRQSGSIQTDTPSSANLRLKSNSILDIYMELFLNECEYLLHNGLIKRYRRTEGNRTALKGSLNFGKHIQQNVVHKERFYVNHSTYDHNNQMNQILLKTIRLIEQISHSALLSSKVGSLILNFPELPDITVTDATFEKINFDRKSSSYKPAIDLAMLLLLNYHPDITQGNKSVLALMFDMNLLWEKWVLRQIQRASSGFFSVEGQSSDVFWKPEKGHHKSLRPDILLKKGADVIVLDTKWKLPKDNQPGDEDLRQMFAYNKLFGSKRSLLVYPGKKEGYGGSYFHDDHGKCEVYFLDVIRDEKLNTDSVKDLLYSLVGNQDKSLITILKDSFTQNIIQ